MHRADSPLMLRESLRGSMAQQPLLFLAFALVFAGALFEFSELLTAFKNGELVYGRLKIRLNRYDDAKMFMTEFRKLSAVLFVLLVVSAVFMSICIA
jgi:hypothetical protein